MTGASTHRDGAGTEPTPAHYADPDLIILYDLEMPSRPDHDFYLTCAGRPGLRVLDVGCGTGTLALAFARMGHTVTGADPAPAMLAAARCKPGADTVTWIEADARTLALGTTFDLVIMTGHAFQVLLGDDDQRQALDAIARHLAPDGVFAFETRNPPVEEWRTWTREQSMTPLRHPRLGDVDVHWEAHLTATPEIVALETHYLFKADGSRRVSHSLLRFASQTTVARHLAEAGLAVAAWYGDWDRSAVTPHSPELIAITRRKPVT